MTKAEADEELRALFQAGLPPTLAEREAVRERVRVLADLCSLSGEGYIEGLYKLGLAPEE